MRVLSLLLVLAALGCDESALPPRPQPAPTVSASAAGPKVHERVILSPVYQVDRIYKSMVGPQSTEQLKLSEKPELLWIVGFEAVMVEPEGGKTMSQEFMCHTNLDMNVDSHDELFGGEKRLTGRLFTLSQGQYRIDLPKGFGIPISSSEVLNLNTQVLNLNRREGRVDVRHRVVMRYVRDADLTTPYKPLYPAGAYGLKLLDGKDGHFGLDATPKNSGAEDHTACLPGQNASTHSFGDGKGRSFTGHWVVKPGREVNHTRVTDIMDLPFDTTLHYVAVHLHPFAETLELKDLTTGKTVYKARTRQADKGIGLAHVDFFSSAEGIPVYKGHEYEIVSTYNNTSGEDQDSMAVMNLYLLDKEFKKPDLSKKKTAPAPAKSAAEHQGHGKLM
ncbi:MAG TPA: hypothetical protein VFB62_12910 [Polyangiaceae bacterium]|nr:hypothetical protein [Polyangiaceae bacterium]